MMGNLEMLVYVNLRESSRGRSGSGEDHVRSIGP